MTNHQQAPVLPEEIRQQLTVLINQAKQYIGYLKAYQIEITDQTTQDQYNAHIELPTIRKQFDQLIHPYIYYVVAPDGPHLTTRTAVSHRYEQPDADAILLAEQMNDVLSEKVNCE